MTTINIDWLVLLQVIILNSNTHINYTHVHISMCMRPWLILPLYLVLVYTCRVLPRKKWVAGKMAGPGWGTIEYASQNAKVYSDTAIDIRIFTHTWAEHCSCISQISEQKELVIRNACVYVYVCVCVIRNACVYVDVCVCVIRNACVYVYVCVCVWDAWGLHHH